MALDFGGTFNQELNIAIQEGRGAAASVIGQTCDVRRLDGTTSISVSNNAPVLRHFPFIPRRAKKQHIENTAFDLLVFESTCDGTFLQIGDLCTQTGYLNDGSRFTVAQLRPTQKNLWVRTEANVSISRPIPQAGAAAQQPSGGAVATSGYAGIWKAEDEQLQLSFGLYTFTTMPGTPAQVACGLQPLNRVRDASSGFSPGAGPQVPTSLYREHFLAYLPLLPGVQLNELDRIHFGMADAYEIIFPFTTEQTGFAGYILLVEKMGTS